MSTSTSRQFDPRVALLWGDRWWIEDHNEPVEFGDIARAAEALVTHFAPAERPLRLRLIYQPGFLAAECMACPQGNRATLKLALGDAYPALASEDRAWGFEPIVGGRDRFATLLYHETQPALYALVERLQAAGIEVESAWPLPSLLNLLPEDWPETGALTVVAVAANQTLVYRHTPEGRREVETAVGAPAQVLAFVTVRDTLARGTALYLATTIPATHRRAVASARCAAGSARALAAHGCSNPDALPEASRPVAADGAGIQRQPAHARGQCRHRSGGSRACPRLRSYRDHATRCRQSERSRSRNVAR